MIPSGITPPITIRNNSKIQSRDIFPIYSRDLSYIPEDNFAMFYNSASFAPTNPKVQMVKRDPDGQHGMQTVPGGRQPIGRGVRTKDDGLGADVLGEKNGAG